MSKYYFYFPEAVTEKFYLSPEESFHAINVLRLKVNDSISVLDGKGRVLECYISDLDSKKKTVEVTCKKKKNFPRPYYLHIAIAPTKSTDRFEWFLEKATELGISEITPLLCNNSERRKINIERMYKILVSAIKQSGQAFIPKLNSLTAFDKFIANNTVSDKYIAHCNDNIESEPVVNLLNKNNSIVLIGPEGDFTQDEVKQAIENNFIPVSLGESRLRTETAGIYVCSYFSIINSTKNEKK